MGHYANKCPSCKQADNSSSHHAFKAGSEEKPPEAQQQAPAAPAGRGHAVVGNQGAGAASNQGVGGVGLGVAAAQIAPPKYAPVQHRQLLQVPRFGVAMMALTGETESE
eukprot:3163636-Rhodomonas_salina.1